jgi:sulfatase maturation enzyme AslB (radical SAM superfamily)
MALMEITTKIGCKNACLYCPQDKLMAAYKKRSHEFSMSFETFKTCIDKLPGYVDVEFSGMSEPWLNPECTRMVLYAHRKKHKINVYTTLVGMTLDDIRQIENVPFGYFWVHLPCREGLENIKVDDNYLKILENILHFLESHKNISVSFHIRGHEPHPKIKSLLKDKIQKRVIGVRANNLDFDYLKPIKRRKGVIACARNLRHNILLPNGDVLLCCMDYGMQHVLGNLVTGDYESLFSSPEFLKVKEGLKDESADIICRYCDVLARNVSLRAKIFNNLQNIHNPKDFLNLMRRTVSKL